MSNKPMAVNSLSFESIRSSFYEEIHRNESFLNATSTLVELKNQGFNLNVITNGVYESQIRKIISMGLENFFQK